MHSSFWLSCEINQKVLVLWILLHGCKNRTSRRSAYISPWSCRRLWYRLVAEGDALLSPGFRLFHWLESHHMVWFQTSSIPRLLHLRDRREERLVNVRLMRCHSFLFWPSIKEKKQKLTGCTLLKYHTIKTWTNWLHMQEWELTGCISGVGRTKV